MAAGATYEPLATTTVSGSSVGSVGFSGISGSYTDLLLVANVLYSANAGDYISLRINGNGTNNNYYLTRLGGNGSTVDGQYSGDNKFVMYTASTTQYVACFFHIFNYANATSAKTILGSVNNAGSYITYGHCYFSPTSAVTAVEIFFAANSIAPNTKLTLYGIKAA